MLVKVKVSMEFNLPFTTTGKRTKLTFSPLQTLTGKEVCGQHNFAVKVGMYTDQYLQVEIDVQPDMIVSI